MLTIEDIKKIPADTHTVANPSTKAVILEIGDVESATPRCKAKFFVILADLTGSISCTVYNISERPKFIKGMTVVLMNILIKQSYICVTEITEVAMAKGYIMPTEIQNSAPKLPGEPTMNIEMALNSPPRTLTGVKGKVVKVSTPTTKEVEQSPVPFQDIYLKDKSATVCVGLWDNMVDTLNVGQMVQMTKCRVRLFNGEKKLTITRASTCQVVSDDKELKDVSSDEESDSIEDPLEKNCEEGSITAVFDMDPYLACPSKGCNNTKLITIEENGQYIMQCKNCKGKFNGSAANSYLRASVLYECNNITNKVAIFQPQIKELFASRGLKFEMSFDKTELMNEMFNIVPLSVRCKVANNTIRHIIVIRDREALNSDSQV